jgi:DSBA-like thioredoxin domain-containing protein
MNTSAFPQRASACNHVRRSSVVLFALILFVGLGYIARHLKENTEAAIAKGAFGCPTFFVKGDMFFGQDRLVFVREALAAQV